jgi:hypothetical protein
MEQTTETHTPHVETHNREGALQKVSKIFRVKDSQDQVQRDRWAWSAGLIGCRREPATVKHL